MTQTHHLLSGKHTGILLPLFSMRSKKDWGIGDIGAMKLWLDFLKSTNLDILEILPINEMPPGVNCPYTSMSAFAIDPIYIAIEDIKEQKDKETVHLNVKDSGKDKNGEKNVYNNIKTTEFIKMSMDNIKKNSLEKVYAEDIYWKKCSKKDMNEQTMVMSSGGQNRSSFNSNIFYTCILSIFFMFETLYLFSGFVMGGRLKVEKVQSGELDTSLRA